jgi:hypothetical protein
MRGELFEMRNARAMLAIASLGQSPSPLGGGKVQPHILRDLDIKNPPELGSRVGVPVAVAPEYLPRDFFNRHANFVSSSSHK